MNSAEELVYWYLRLNGFFPLTNFVIHKSSEIEYSSDCDVLAIRPPNVYEEIGGKPDDFDPILSERGVNLSCFTGVICEVKSGDFSVSRIFKKDNIKYAIGRIGLTSADDINNNSESLFLSRSIEIPQRAQICKILFSNEAINSNVFVSITLNEVRDFLKKRIQKYPIEKFRDRMFFGSILVQEYIDIYGRELHRLKTKI